MYLVKVKNIINGLEFSPTFSTESEAGVWLEKEVERGTFGKPARQVIKGEEIYDNSLMLSEFEDQYIDDFGSEATRTIVSLKAEYTISGPVFLDGSGTTEEDRQMRMMDAQKRAEMFRVFKDFGETVELYFTSLINERSYTQGQKDAIQSDADVLLILGELKFGRIAKAKGMIDQKSADQSLFYADDLSKVSQLMSDFLEDYPLNGES